MCIRDRVKEAIKMDSRSRSELTAAMKDMTALDNPNSVQQMKQWLSANGLETDSLGKKVVAELIKKMCIRDSCSSSQQESVARV